VLTRNFLTTVSNLVLMSGLCFTFSSASFAQTAPSAFEIANYSGLFAAVINGDMNTLNKEIKQSKSVDQRDSYARTALHLATYTGNHRAMQALVSAGANANALEQDRYDIVTIAAVANDLETMKLALKLGCRADNITSRYDGTALIAAAHLGHDEVVDRLIRAGAPLDHVNNLHWTALIESIVLGDGGERHIATLTLLVEAGADLNLADRSGRSPLALARLHGHEKMVEILQAAGAD
jgi:ankyrin repeat protein